MKSITVFAAALALATSAVHGLPQSDVAVNDGSKNWSYKTNDPSVYPPAAWKEKAATCGGQRQSPIDIKPKQLCRTAGLAKKESPLVLSGECNTYQIKQYYDAFKAEPTDGTCQVSANGKPYQFLQAHFHAPSEHTIDGKAQDAEIHYVHKGDDGLLVIGLFFEKNDGATTDPYVRQFWQQIKAVTTEKPAKNVTLGSFFPSLESTIGAGRLFNYPGGLTSPSCDEIVDWWVVEKPLKVSAADFDDLWTDLKRIEASENGKAARPTQPLNGRNVTAY